MHPICIHSVMMDSEVSRYLEDLVEEIKPIKRSQLFITKDWQLVVEFEFEKDNQLFVETFTIGSNGWIPRYYG